MTRIQFITILLVVGGVGLVAPFFAYAHGTGESLEAEVGEYLIDIGYDPPTIESDDPVVFDFILKQGEAEAEFDSVWVRIYSKEREVVFAGGLDRGEAGRTVLTYAFPRGGEYSLSARFQKNGAALAEQEFPIAVVSPRESGVSRRDTLLVACSFAGGALLVAGYSFRKRFLRP